MALRSTSLHHSRSLSLPSASHPALSHFDDSLSTSTSSSAAACSSLSSMNLRINGLRNLYESLDDLLHIQQQQFISDECVVDCISILDGCSTVREVISIVKEDLRKLLSAVRRKDGGGIKAYLSSRRNSKNMIQKSLKSLRRGGASSVSSSEERSVVSMLKEAECAALSVLESLLYYVSGTRMQEKKSSWSLVSKLVHSHKTSHNHENEFNKLDSLLQMNQENELVNQLKEMESSIHVLEEDLESVFRQLIKTRVSLLNILNH